MKRELPIMKLATSALLVVLLVSSCVPGTYTPPRQPTPQERMARDINYCHSQGVNYLRAKEEMAKGDLGGNFWAASSLSSTISTYEWTCHGITLGYVLPRDVLLSDYQSGRR